MASEKNLEFLIHGLIELLKQESGTHVLMVGHGPLEAAMVSAFRQAGLGERFHLAGFLHNQELIDAYSAMDIFAFTSLSETQGIVLAEAMAVGIPVVAVEAPAVGEMVQDGFNGRLIKGGLDEQRFVEALSWGLHCDPAQRRSLEEHARETARHYSIHVCGKHMLKVYEHVREKELMHFESKDNAWQALTERIKAEWDMLKNIVEAGEAAMFEKMPLGWRERENA